MDKQSLFLQDQPLELKHSQLLMTQLMKEMRQSLLVSHQFQGQVQQKAGPKALQQRLLKMNLHQGFNSQHPHLEFLKVLAARLP